MFGSDYDQPCGNEHFRQAAITPAVPIRVRGVAVQASWRVTPASTPVPPSKIRS
jgi:hypothetical protein